MLKFKTIKISVLIAVFCSLIPVISVSQEYNRRADYIYNFEKSDAEIIPAAIVKGKLILPDFNESYHTAFLEVDMRTSLCGRLIEPNVRLNADGINTRQYFEYGVKGKRYVNISRFVRQDIKSINLTFSKCHIAGKQVNLILFENPEVHNENPVVLAPHPDDAEIAAYGLYSSNKNSFVATITVGDAGKKMYDELYTDDSIHYIKKAEIRLWNSITVPMLAGLNSQNIVNLGYFDASLKKMYTDSTHLVKSRYTDLEDINIFRKKNISEFLDSVKGTSNWRSLVNDMKFIVNKKKPTVIVTPYPAIDVHPDHKLTTIALIQALKELNFFNVELWLYTNHFIYDELYPEGKVRSIVSLPPNTKDKTIYFKRICSFPLTSITQSDKALALESMNPLRPDTEWHTIKGSRKLYWKTFRENIHNTETDYYYRRAVRDNELFFVVDMKDLLNDSIFKLVTGDLNF